jgi:hypothetical protein
MFRKLRLAAALVLLGISLQHLPVAAETASSWYSSYQDWRLEKAMNDLSRRIEFGQKCTHSEGYKPDAEDAHLLARSTAYFQIAQEARAEGDSEAAWKAVRLSQDRMQAFERRFEIK